MNLEFAESGFAVHRGALTSAQCDDLIAALDSSPAHQAGPSVNRRHLLRDVPAVAYLAASGPVMQLARQYLQGSAFAVRGLLLDKADAANWSVAWHQDVTIAVQSRREIAGYSGWSVKGGVVHVHPPADVLEQMVAIRVHLDDCDENNGALEILPGSHLHGILDSGQIEAWRKKREPIVCAVKRGDVIVMRPLLLHASSRATAPRHRRVIHLEYGAGDLSNGLEWSDRVA